jgi:hypothetical protein
MAQKRLLPEQEAAYALDHGIPRSSLSMGAQLAYDELSKEHPGPLPGVGADEKSTPPQPLQNSSCGTCEELLTPNARFCASCGQPVTMDAQDTACRECGEELTPDARFCAACGEPTGGAATRKLARKPSPAGEKKLQEFNAKYVTFYDGSGHRLGPSECTLTTMRLIIADARGGIHQILLRDISGIGTPSRLAAPKMLRIKLLGQTYDIDCVSRDQKSDLESWLSQAIRGSLS